MSGPMISVGVTGGIASGKSTLVREWERLGARVIDADRVGWRLLGRADLRESILYAFGPDVLGESGEIDRGRLARAAFRDEDSAERLDAILHPPILAELRRWIEAQRARDDSGVVAVEASVIIEAGGTDLVDYLVLVSSPVPARLERLGRKGMSAEDARRRMRLQKSDEQKRPFADFELRNEGSEADLVAAAAELYRKVAALPRRGEDEQGRKR